MTRITGTRTKASSRRSSSAGRDGGKGAITPVQKDALLTDAAPRSLYVQRKLLNSAAFIKWAKGQGFTTTTPADELHVTVLFSRTPSTG
jgi:hypothetical protein